MNQLEKAQKRKLKEKRFDDKHRWNRKFYIISRLIFNLILLIASLVLSFFSWYLEIVGIFLSVVVINNMRESIFNFKKWNIMNSDEMKIVKMNIILTDKDIKKNEYKLYYDNYKSEVKHLYKIPEHKTLKTYDFLDYNAFVILLMLSILLFTTQSILIFTELIKVFK